MNYLSALIDTPIIPLRPEITELFQDYFMLLIKMKRMGAKPNKDLISTMLLTILHGVGSIHQNTNVTTRTFNRGEEIVKRLVQYIIKHYTKERSVAFYADLLHISPQHLSTTVNKITGKTSYRYHRQTSDNRCGSQTKIHRSYYSGDSLFT